MSHEAPTYAEVDPFDLPEWLGECHVTWDAERGLSTGHRVTGALAAADHDPLPCDLLAVDDAYPEPVATDAIRVRAHQVWRHGEVMIAEDHERMLLVVPGSRGGHRDRPRRHRPSGPGRRWPRPARTP